MSSLDWPAMLRLGLTQLRLRPDEFWRLTPVEFLLLAGREQGGTATTREALERLAGAFPDQRIAR